MIRRQKDKQREEGIRDLEKLELDLLLETRYYSERMRGKSRRREGDFEIREDESMPVLKDRIERPVCL